METLSPKTKEIIDHIGRARNELLASVTGLADHQVVFRPGVGAWSIGDVLHHLALAEEASAKLMALMLRRAQEEGVPPDPEPEASVLGSIDAIVAGTANGKATAPDRVTPRSQLPPGEALARLKASRKSLVGALESLSAFDLSQLRFPHPFFGELDVYQWTLITGWHEQRHTRQIERVKASPGFPEL